MKTIVIYQSNYGATKQYALWIAQALCADISECSKINPDKLLQYDTIILGGGLYAGGIAGTKVLVKNSDKLGDRNIIVFTVGLADISKAENIEHIKVGASKIFPSKLLPKIKLYHFRGSIDYTKLSFIHRIMMGMLKKMILKKPPEKQTQEDLEILETFGQAVDFKDKASIIPLVEYVKTLTTKVDMNVSQS